MRTAILVDGGFYRKRAQACLGSTTPKERADQLFSYCLKHLDSKQGVSSLYRIFYYDCEPISKKVYHPLLKRTVDFSKTETYTWMLDFLRELSFKRKIALRLGVLAEEQAHFILPPQILKKLFKGDIKLEDIGENDFRFQVQQKQVDMKIGLDIASIAFKRQVDQIILISGDSDFVSAAKHARREGIDFVLDNLWNPIKPELNLHIDGLVTKDDKFRPKRN